LTLHQPYLTDLTNAEFCSSRPASAATDAIGRPRLHASREILNAIFYVVRSGPEVLGQYPQSEGAANGRPRSITSFSGSFRTSPARAESPQPVGPKSCYTAAEQGQAAQLRCLLHWWADRSTIFAAADAVDHGDDLDACSRIATGVDSSPRHSRAPPASAVGASLEMTGAGSAASRTVGVPRFGAAPRSPAVSGGQVIVGGVVSRTMIS
jgi:hypothetical protein